MFLLCTTSANDHDNDNDVLVVTESDSKLFQLRSRIEHATLPSLQTKSSCLRSCPATEVRTSRVAVEIVRGCWKHLQDSASTSVYWTSVVRRRRLQACSVHVLLRRRRRHVVWYSSVSSRTSQPTETSTSVVTPLTDNKLSTSHRRTKLPLYFTQLNKPQETSSSPSKVTIILLWTMSLLFNLFDKSTLKILFFFRFYLSLRLIY